MREEEEMEEAGPSRPRVLGMIRPFIINVNSGFDLLIK
jgi:hypothetical protein